MSLSISPDVAEARARRAALARHRGASDPAALAAKTNLAAAQLEAYIQRVVARAPELSSSQRSRLAALLTSEAA
ncbi:MAG: hypothetical protein K0R99_4007 [Microbacterium sp.]|nr:hypothetical protein [Microbacterium sp.]